LEVVGNTGGGSPAQIGGTALNVGIKIGSDNTTPVVTTAVLPLLLNMKLVYKPAFSPGMDNTPLPFDTTVTGPFVMPSSV
jgi:hypothetical protein